MAADAQNLWSSFVREPRLWVTVLWSITLALGITGWDWSARRLAGMAAEETIILYPQHPLDETAQHEWQTKLSADPAIFSARWLGPEQLRQELARSLPTTGLGGLLEQNSAAFPMLMELVPDRPLERTSALNEFISARNAEGNWVVFWDGSRLAQLRSARNAWRTVLGGWIGLTLITGGFALARLAWPTRNRLAFSIASGVLGAVAPLALVLGAAQAGLPDVNGRTMLLAGAAGLLFGSGFASMLKLRPGELDTLESPRRGSSINLSVKEAPDERNW